MNRVISSIMILAVVAGFSHAGQQPISITSPAGGEVYIEGQTQFVRVASKAKSVLIEISRDSGTTFTTLGTIDNKTKDTNKRGVLSFVVAAPDSSNCVIRATANGTMALSGAFTITSSLSSGGGTAGGDLTGTYPNPTIALGAVTSTKIGSGAASANFVLTADGTGKANWLAPAGATGTAGGDLAGTYPNPTISAVAGNDTVAAINNAATTSKINGSQLVNTDNVQSTVISAATVVPSGAAYADVTSISYTKQNASSVLKITASGSVDLGGAAVLLRITDGSGTVLAGPHAVSVNSSLPQLLTAGFSEVVSGIPKGNITIKLQGRGGGTLAPSVTVSGATDQTKFSVVVEEH